MSVTTKLNNIVLIDDDVDDCFVFEEAIKEISPDINLTCITNSSDILSLLLHCRPDLLFLDINMPLKNGFECLKEMQEKKELKSVPVVIFSSSSYSKDINVAYGLGASLYLPKPTNFNELVASLRQILELTWDSPSEITEQYFENGQYRPFLLKEA